MLYAQRTLTDYSERRVVAARVAETTGLLVNERLLSHDRQSNGARAFFQIANGGSSSIVSLVLNLGPHNANHRVFQTLQINTAIQMGRTKS